MRTREAWRGPVRRERLVHRAIKPRGASRVSVEDTGGASSPRRRRGGFSNNSERPEVDLGASAKLVSRRRRRARGASSGCPRRVRIRPAPSRRPWSPAPSSQRLRPLCAARCDRPGAALARPRGGQEMEKRARASSRSRPHQPDLFSCQPQAGVSGRRREGPRRAQPSGLRDRFDKYALEAFERAPSTRPEALREETDRQDRSSAQGATRSARPSSGTGREPRLELGRGPRSTCADQASGGSNVRMIPVGSLLFIRRDTPGW